MAGEDCSPIARAWACSAASMADAVQVADLMAVTWGAIDRVLRPIIGQRGLAALFQRSLHLSAAAHAWLVDVDPGGADPSRAVIALRDAQSQQGCAEAVAAGVVLLHCFHELLASLIGRSITERLLRPAWEAPLRPPPPREPPP